MKNWSTDEERLKIVNKDKYAIWQLEQMVNFGLADGEKLSVAQLKKYWNQIDIDMGRRRLLEILMYES